MNRKLEFILVISILLFFSSDKFPQIEEKNLNDQRILEEIRLKKETNSTNKKQPNVDFEKMPLNFIKNQGQVNQEVRFYARASKYTLWLTREGMVFDCFRPARKVTDRSKDFDKNFIEENKFIRDVSQLVFRGVNKNLKILSLEPSDQYSWHATAGDIDSDGDVDLFVAVNSDITDWSDPEGCTEPSRFYENIGDGNFQDSSNKIPDLSNSCQMLLGDYNGDGSCDVFLCSSIRTKLIIHSGTWTG